MRFVQTEIEYIVFVCRSLFDLIQEMMATIWKEVTIRDESVNKQPLPESFAKIVAKGDVLRTSQDISATYGLSIIISDWYERSGKLFLALRELRNRVTHSGSMPFKELYYTDRGYAINPSEQPWSAFYDWPSESKNAAGLVPLRALLCAIIECIILYTDDLAVRLNEAINFPKELFPGLTLYSRGCYDEELYEMKYAARDAWWCETRLSLIKKMDAPSSIPLHERGTSCRSRLQRIFQDLWRSIRDC